MELLGSKVPAHIETKIRKKLRANQVKRSKSGAALKFEEYLLIVALASQLATRHLKTRDPAEAFESVLRLIFLELTISNAEAEQVFRLYVINDPAKR